MVLGGHSHIFFVLGYLILLGFIGFYLTKRRIKSNEDFMTANRSLPLLIMAGTLLATWYGGGGITGTANFTFKYGPIAGFIFEMAGTPIAVLLIWFIAGKIRDTGKHTIPELFEEKYGPLAGLLVSVFIVLAYVGIVSYQFKGAGYILNLTTGMSLDTGTLLAAVFIIFLAASGGMVTIAYTDALSALFIVAGFAIGIPIIFFKVGGVAAFFSQIPTEKMTLIGSLKPIQAWGYFLPIIFLILGDQNMFQRYGAAKDVKTARKSALWFLIGSGFLSAATVIFSASAIILYPDLARPDTALLQVALGSMPFVLGGVILAAAVAFMITTGDSFLMSGATNVTYDIIKRYIKREATESQLLKYTRRTIVVMGVFAYFTIKFFPDILSMMMYSYSVYGATVTPPLIAAFLWKRVTRYGGLWSIIVGGSVTLIWEIVLKTPFGWNSLLVAAPLSVLTLVIVSLLTQGANQPSPVKTTSS